MFPKRNRLLKLVIVVLSLLAVIAVSMLSVTLSAYVKELQLFGGGWVGPKYFAFDIGNDAGTKSLAPGETVSYDFSVSNFDGNGVAQVPLHVSIEIAYPAQLAGTGAIRADLYHGGSLLASDTGSGSLAATGETLPANSATTDSYTLSLTWIDSDMTLLGDKVGETFDPSTISISVSGYQ